MAHFAKVVNNQVVDVIVANESFFDHWIDPTPGRWIQVSYNTRGNVHYGPDGLPDGGLAVRGNYPSLGFTYDSVNDVFYSPQPWPSWILDTNTWTWEPPVPSPDNDLKWYWDEESLSWKEGTVPPASTE